MAYITVEQTKTIRQLLKKEFTNIKFSVRNEHHSSVHVEIRQSNIDFSEYLGGEKYASVNEHNNEHHGQHKKLFAKIFDIIKNGTDNKYYNNSDVQTDYFDYAFYFYLSIGGWDRPYIFSK